MTPLALLLVLLSAPSTPTAPAALGTGAIVIEDLPGGALDAPSARGGVVARVLLHASTEAVWKTLTEYERQPEFMPFLTDVRLVGSDGAAKLVRYRSHSVLIDLDYTLRRVEEPMHRISWTRASGDLKVLEGYWGIEPAEGGTVVTYSSYVETGFPVPRWIQDPLSRREVRGLLGNLRRRVESGGTWTKPGWKGSPPTRRSVGF